tara:strand:- start:378 stop:557 length:180 start_codon:yes stop_codon:yes gene_type:complete
MLYLSDSASAGLDKIIDQILYSEISNKDLVISKDKLYNYRVVLEKVRSGMTSSPKSGKE